MTEYLVKISIRTFFLGGTYFVVQYLLDILNNYYTTLVQSSDGSDGVMVSNSLSLVCQFGLLNALNVFLSIIVSSYLTKQVLSFWK
ncbi:MAG: Unknown protein [uncultured Campylobacterales bacterium]|uniref:DUF2523 domain-containing protein n=1 Tax=uncultured Campylobacterales bacterium TaxID=352960 RepID=A0A6S6SNM5_9BACT|nr:MAG: Unknown protein [uncultured Campylobacterales bacterium]